MSGYPQFLSRLLLTCVAALIIAAPIEAQSIRRVHVFSPPLGNSTSGEVAVVENTGLVYNAGQSAFGGNIGVFDPVSRSFVKVIRPANQSSPASMFFSRVNQAQGIVYFAYSSLPDAQIVAVDGRPSSKNYNALLNPIVFPGQSLVTFAIDQTRNRLYATTRTTGANPAQSSVHIINIDPSSAAFHQILSTVALPPGQQAGNVAVNTVTNKIYVATQSSFGGVYFFDGTQQVLNFIAGTRPAGPIMVNEVSNTIYAGNMTATSIQAIDGISNIFTTDIPLPVAALVGSVGENVAVNPVTERVYASLATGTLSVIDARRTSPTFNSVVANIPGLGLNGEVAVDPQSNKIIVASGNDFRTSIIDGVSNTVVGVTYGNLNSLDVAIDSSANRAFVGHSFYSTQIIDLIDNSFSNIGTVAEIGTGIANPNNGSLYFGYSGSASGIRYLDQNDNLGFVPGSPHQFGRNLFSALHTGTNRVYTANSAANLAGMATVPNFVSVVDANSNAIIANVEIGGQPFADPAVNETTNKIYVQNAGLGPLPSSISVIDGSSNTASFVNTSAFPPNTVFIDRIVANPLTNRIYFKTGQGSGAGVIDGSTDVATPLVLGPTRDILVNAVLNRVYFLTATALLVLDGANDSLIATVPLSLPSAFAVNQTNGRVFVVSSNNKTLTVLDANGNIIGSSLSLAATPNSIAVNTATNRVYIGTIDLANEGNSTIAFIDGSSLIVTRTLPVPLIPSRLSVNPTTKTLYATTVNATQRTGVVIISDTPARVR